VLGNVSGAGDQENRCDAERFRRELQTRIINAANRT
jgi:hypothetical protein